MLINVRVTLINSEIAWEKLFSSLKMILQYFMKQDDYHEFEGFITSKMVSFVYTTMQWLYGTRVCIAWTMFRQVRRLQFWSFSSRNHKWAEKLLFPGWSKCGGSFKLCKYKLMPR